MLKSTGRNVLISGKWLMISSPFPDHEDNNPSFGIHSETGSFNCLGCERHGNIKELKEVLSDLDLLEIDQLDTPSELKWMDALKSIHESYDMKDRKEYQFSSFRDGKTREMGREEYSYARQRGLDANTIKEMNLGIIHHVDYGDRLVFPVCDKIGVIWYEGRAIRKDTTPKYWRPLNTQSSNVLYNYVNVLEENYVIVVEGVIDVAILHQWGYPAVCCFGSRLYSNQYILLSNFESVYFCFDGDLTGRKAMKTIREDIMRDLGNQASDFYFIILPANKDIPDISESFFQKRFNKAKKIVVL